MQLSDHEATPELLRVMRQFGRTVPCMYDGSIAQRFAFIGHALRADGPFRPTTYDNGAGAVLSGQTCLVRYQRESDRKFGARNAVAFGESLLALACSRFVGYLSARPPIRTVPHDLYAQMIDDIDGRGNSIDVWWQEFIMHGKARGSMLLLVDMPRSLPGDRGTQVAQRLLPYWLPVLPEDLTDYELGDDGRFLFAEFGGTIQRDGKQVPCRWRFDAQEWRASSIDGDTVLDSGTHGLGECPLLIWTEGLEFPAFGPFSAIADVSKRLFNIESELDEILRSQTFSVLTMAVPDNTTEAQKLAAAQTAGQTIGTQNLIVHSGPAPAFIAPPDGPARVYMDRIAALRQRIDNIGLNVATIEQQESGIAMTMRFQQVNAELIKCAVRSEDLERRAWDLSARWLGLSAAPSVNWSRDYQIADVRREMEILDAMQTAQLPAEVVAEQQRRVVAAQFSGADADAMDRMIASIDERLRGITTAGANALDDGGGNVVPLHADRNSEVRAAIVQALNAGG